MQTIQRLAMFAAAVRRSSFAGAAREIGTTPSAVAKAVQRLETDLEVCLFHRTTRRITLTAEGTRVYEHCRRALAELDAMRGEAAGPNGAPLGTLGINAPLA